MDLISKIKDYSNRRGRFKAERVVSEVALSESVEAGAIDLQAGKTQELGKDSFGKVLKTDRALSQGLYHYSRASVEVYGYAYKARRVDLTKSGEFNDSKFLFVKNGSVWIDADFDKYNPETGKTTSIYRHFKKSYPREEFFERAILYAARDYFTQVGNFFDKTIRQQIEKELKP